MGVFCSLWIVIISFKYLIIEKSFITVPKLYVFFSYCSMMKISVNQKKVLSVKNLLNLERKPIWPSLVPLLVSRVSSYIEFPLFLHVASSTIFVALSFITSLLGTVSTCPWAKRKPSSLCLLSSQTPRLSSSLTRASRSGPPRGQGPPSYLEVGVTEHPEGQEAQELPQGPW